MSQTTDSRSSGGRVGGDLGVLHVLGPDPQDDAAPLEALQARIARERRLVQAKPLVAEAHPDVAVRPLEPGFDEVHRRRADELRDEELARALVELLGRGDLLEEPAPHHRNTVAHRHRLGLVVRHVDGRHTEVALDARDLGSHLDAELRVEVRERLVHEERLRVTHDRSSHRDPLALAAGERARLLLQRLREPENPCRFADATIDLVLREPAHLQCEAHVPMRIHVRIERVVLKDHRDVAILRRKVVHDLPVDLHRAGGDRLEARNHAERRRLPAPRWARRRRRTRRRRSRGPAR